MIAEGRLLGLDTGGLGNTSRRLCASRLSRLAHMITFRRTGLHGKTRRSGSEGAARESDRSSRSWLRSRKLVRSCLACPLRLPISRENAESLFANKAQTGQSSADIRAAADRAFSNVHAVATSTEELSSSINEIGIRVVQSSKNCDWKLQRRLNEPTCPSRHSRPTRERLKISLASSILLQPQQTCLR